MGIEKRTPLGRVIGGILLIFSIITFVFLMKFQRVGPGEELDLHFFKTDKDHGWYVLGLLILFLFALFGLMAWVEKRVKHNLKD